MLEHIVTIFVALYTLYYFWRAFQEVWEGDTTIALYYILGGITFSIITAINIRLLL